MQNTTSQGQYVSGASAKPASVPKKLIAAKPTSNKTYTPLGPIVTSAAVPTVEEPQITAAMTSSNARNRLVNAVKFGHQIWRGEAYFKSLKINAGLALGTAGCLHGPGLAAKIDTYPDIQCLTGLEVELYEAVRDGVDSCFDSWRSQVTVPSLPWYPAFVAFPGPAAPPTPNVPSPLLACISTQALKLGQPALKQAMTNALRSELRTADVLAMFDNIALQLSTHFMTWLACQMVTQVMGKGPVPSFAPPYVPVGPVVMGDNLPTPGHLKA